jgi:hypothetical protein
MSRSAIAGGDVYPSRIVYDDSTAGQMIQATAATQRLRGVAFKDTRRSPYVDSSGKIAASGEPFSFYDTPGERCWIEIAGTVSKGDKITTNGSGQGITTTTDKNQCVAIADQAGVSGDVIQCTLYLGELSV